ncbi:MAG: 7-cyano-7-deazaguanine synthase QueC [Nitrososphaerales archaeon]
MAKTVCIISGGADSACTAAHLKSNGHDLYVITFYYGQRSKTEMEKAKMIADHLHVSEYKVVDIGFMKEFYAGSNVLTDNNSSMPSEFNYSIVVPIRNAIFLTIASAWAFSIGAEMVAYGAHKDDINYPDCRPEFVKSINQTINLAENDGIKEGVRKEIKIWCPAIDQMGKKDLLRIGYKLLGYKLFETWSCYNDGSKYNNELLHCGKCESCMNRKKAFIEAGIEDKTKYKE